MNLYDKSSLILIPSAVKDGKVYSQRPENGDGDFTFSRASTATRVNKNGLIESVGSNEPRLDYSGEESCPSLLLEPQRTNYVPYSEQLDNNSQTGGTYIPNAEISPDGTRNAYGIDQDSAGDRVQPNIGTYDGLVTLSMYIKPVATIRPRLNVYNSVNGSVYGALFQWDGTDFTITSDGEGYTNAGYENTGNGWYRLWVVGTSISGGNILGQFRPNTNSDISNRLYFWGLQAERGSYPTSYIPTSGSAVTRSIEPNQLGKTDLITDGFFSSTELTWFIDIDLFEKDSGTSVAPRLVNSSNGNIFIGLNETLGGNLNIRHKNGTTAANTSGVSFDENGQRFKVLVKVSGTTGEAFINGSSMGTFTTLAASNYDEFENVAANAYDLRQMLMFPTALTDSECIELTTL